MKKLARALSARIKSLREVTGLSQQEIAERGDLSVSLVGKLEQGKKADPRASTILALAGALGVKPGQLLDNLFSEPAKAEPPPEMSDVPMEAHHSANGAVASAGKKKKKEGKKKKKKTER